MRFQDSESLDFHLDGFERRRCHRPGHRHRAVWCLGHVGHVPPAHPLRPLHLDHHTHGSVGLHSPDRRHTLPLSERSLAPESVGRTLG